MIGYIATELGGITDPVDPYLSNFTATCFNVYVFPVVHPRILGWYFNDYNAIDQHN